MFKESVICLIILAFYYSIYRLEILLAVLCYHILYPQVYSKISLYYKPSEFTEKILSHCPSLLSRYRPTIWLWNGLLQTFFEGTTGELEGKTIFCDDLKYQREFLILPDSGLMSIDWTLNSNETQKILIVGPGLTGDSSSQYIRHVALKAMELGFRVAVLQGRGIAGNKLTVTST